MISKLRAYYRKYSPGLALSLINLPKASEITGNSDPNTFLPALANRLALILTYLAYPLAFIGVVYSAYLLLANSGNPDAQKMVKKNIGYIATGIFLLVLTIVIFNFFARVFQKDL
jgi:hypothetical protein